MIEGQVAHSMEEYSQVVSDKVFKDLFLHPFSHNQTFLMPTAHRDQGYRARNNCFAEADHDLVERFWPESFAVAWDRAMQDRDNSHTGVQRSWMQLQQEAGSYIYYLLGWF